MRAKHIRYWQLLERGQSRKLTNGRCCTSETGVHGRAGFTRFCLVVLSMILGAGS